VPGPEFISKPPPPVFRHFGTEPTTSTGVNSAGCAVRSGSGTRVAEVGALFCASPTECNDLEDGIHETQLRPTNLTYLGGPSSSRGANTPGTTRIIADAAPPAAAADDDDDDFQAYPQFTRLRRARATPTTRSASGGSGRGTGTHTAVRPPPPQAAVDVDNDDDDFVNLLGLNSPGRDRNDHHARVEEERNMTRLDEEWIRVNLAYDVLRRTGDSAQVDKSDLHARTYGNASRNNASRFWHMLESTMQTISEPDQVAAWETLLRRRELRRGLPESTVNDELATVMLQPDMEMWNLSQVELFFLEQAHPDWEK
jgi:hypothetical protein